MDTSENSEAAARPTKRGWRRHSDEFKSRVVAAARRPNVSAAAVALANGLNANMLRRWVREAEDAAAGDAQRSERQSGATVPGFVQLAMRTQPSLTAATSPQAVPSVVVEIQRNGATVRASLPLDSRSAAWLREVTG